MGGRFLHLHHDQDTGSANSITKNVPFVFIRAMLGDCNFAGNHLSIDELLGRRSLDNIIAVLNLFFK